MTSKDRLDHAAERPIGTVQDRPDQRTTHAKNDDDALSDRFIELTPGLITSLEANVNHLLTGRRGVGKSTTLSILHQRAESKGRRVIFVDVEEHKSRDYPDVLIEIILDIIGAIRPAWRLNRKTWTLRRRIKELTGILNFLRDAGPEIEEHHSDSDSRGRDYKISMGGAMAASFARVTGKSSASREVSRKHSRSTTRTRRKEEFLRDLAPAIADLLELSANQDGAKSLIVVLDDFYFVPRATQPLVLDHLHGFTKKSNVWLKIGSVQSRTQTFADGDPPRGMQPPHDVQHLSLDVGLADFHTAKAFLEDVTANILRPIDLRLQDVLTEKARERAVLIAGGAVSRDYFDLLIAAADQAWESAQREQKADGQFMIDTEDIQAAARVRLERKQKDLRNDAGRDASSLERRFEDVVKFVRDRDTFFFLVRQDHIDLDWGREIVELEDLRFVHRIMTTRPNTSAHRGVDTVVFMVDLPAIITRRARKAPVEFWKQGQGDKLRRAQWIYDPSWTTTPAKSSKSPSDRNQPEDKSLEPTLFDD